MYSNISSLQAFLEKVQTLFSPDRIDSFWGCRPAFEALLATPIATDALNAGFSDLARSPHAPEEWTPSEVVLHSGGGTALILSHASAESRYLHLLPYHALYAVADGTTLSYARYATPENFHNEVFDPSLRLAPPQPGTLAPGQALEVPCGQFCLDIRGPRDALLLKFVTTALQPLEWLFKRDTLQAWQANDSDLSFTQLRVAADVLGKLAHQSSVKPLKLMTGHGHHAVRWAAITNLGRINRSEAVEALKIALGDPHPHVHNAAKKTLAKLGL